jgi:hypothetical protein
VDHETDLREAHALWQRGELEEAERTLRAIIRAEPTHAAATHELGALLVQAGQQRLGISLLKRANSLEPTASGLNDLGMAYVASSNIAEALTAFRDAVVMDPTYAEGYNSLGRAFLNLGNIEPGADALRRALLLDGHSEEAWSRFCAALREAATPGANALLTPEIAAGLATPGPHREHLVAFAIGIVTADPALQAILRAAGLGDMDTVRAHLFGESVTRVMDGGLMPRLLAVGVLPSPPYETLFTELRRRFALDMQAGRFSASHDKLPFLCGLAHQCFLTGYVWRQRDDESDAVRDLEQAVATEIQNPTPTTPLRIALLAAYAPLASLAFARDIAAYAGAQASEELRDLARAQIAEPAREAALLSEAGVTAASVGATCSRWVDAAEEQPVALSAMLSLRFPYLRDGGFDGLESPRVLVHGCGPGKDAIAWARNVDSASVVGVESNHAELGFALRKAYELGLTNVSFVSADPGGGFDVVVCPVVVSDDGDLASALGRMGAYARPGGWLHVGVQAETSREHTAAAREFARDGGYDDSAAGVRACRRALLDLPDDVEWKAVGLDFGLHTHAGCHALFFGDERPYATVSSLAQALDASSLEFLGFENEQAIAAYRRAFPSDEQARDLDAWATLEGQEPELFTPMYTFWARKRA